MNLWLIFLTGLTTGGITCAAMQAGLLISAIAGQRNNRTSVPSNDLNLKPSISAKTDWLPVGMFLMAKLIAYTAVGFLLGAVGSFLTIGLGWRLALQLFTVFYMFATAMNLLNIHPVFRFVVITPPKFIQRKIRGVSRNQTLFTPAILGIFTIFIPCGVTQAMEVLAVSSGDALRGALIMASFVLGTMPLFALIGLAAAKLSRLWHERFLKFAAVILIIMSLYSLNGILTVLDAPLSVNNLLSTYQRLQQFESGSITGTSAKQVGGVQKVTIVVNNRGYNPTYIKVNQGIPVELTVTTNNIYSCATAFTLRAFNIYHQLKPTDSQTFTFTPDKPGRYTYSCSMGMYTGILEVI